MNNLITWIKDNPIRSMFLVPIFLVAGISISHVVAWYDITNPFNWAIYLSIAIEIGAITALIAATQKIKGGVWFMFGLVTFVQMVGNIFYSYKEIDPTGDLFKSWVELTSPIFEMFGTESTDIISHKRWLAILSGGLLPVISLTSLHFFVKYQEPEKPIVNETEATIPEVNDEVVTEATIPEVNDEVVTETTISEVNDEVVTETTISEVNDEAVTETTTISEVNDEVVTETTTLEPPKVITETTTINIMVMPNPPKPKGRKLTYTKIK